MSRKNVATSQIASEQSLASDFQTDWYTITHQDNAGFLVDCNNVSDNTGTFEVQVRMKLSDGTFSAPASLTLSSTPTLADANEEFFINLNQVPATQVRLAFTAAGGTPDGDCDIYLHTKQVGG